MDSKQRVEVAKSLLKLAKQINGFQEWSEYETGPEVAGEEVESDKLLKMNPQLNTIARRLTTFNLSISDMLTAVLMAMKLKGAPMNEVNKAYTLMRPMLKRIV